MRLSRWIGRTAAAVACAAALGGCATYQAVGMYPERNEVLVGTVNADLMAGGSNFTLTGRTTGLACEGSTDVTRVTMSLSCQGQSGNVNATCSDGTILRGHWYATSCTTGFGYGIDSHGNKLTFRFGLSDGQVKAQVASDEKALAIMRARERAAERPQVPAQTTPNHPATEPGSQAL